LRRQLILSIILISIFSIPAFAYESLQEVFDNAGPSGDYTKYLELDPMVEYSGDLYIDQQMMVYINGNGALIYSSDSMAVFISFGDLTITNCVIIGGQYGVYFGLNSSGKVYSNTINQSGTSGISINYQNMDKGVEVWDNIITDCAYGFICIEEYHPSYIGYNTIYNARVYRYAEWCPD
jgi:hypothetical protein